MLSLCQLTKELFAEKTRIILTILAITWATFAISSMLSIGEGLRVTFGKAVSTLENQLTINGGKTSKPYQGLPANQSVNLTKSDYQIIKKTIKNIALISPVYVSKKGSLQYKNKLVNARVLAINADYAAMNKLQMKASGRFVSPIDIKKFRSVIALGSEVKFPGIDDPTGKTVLLNGQPFLVIGIMKKKTQLGGKRYSSAYQAWIPYSTYELSENPYFMDTITISYKNPKFLDNMKNEIRKVVALNHHVDPTDEDIVRFHDFVKRQATVNDFFLGMQIFLGLIGLLTLIVAGVGVANVMYASVSKATHEIGIRMAVGARTHQILWRYIAEALTATAIGGALGILMSSLLVYATHLIPMHGKLFDHIGQPRPILSLSVLIIVILILGLIGFLAGLFPALKASRVDPSEALRYE